MGRRITKFYSSEATFLLLVLPMFLLWSSDLKKTSADTMVTGSVFCDLCRDGQRSIIDYPLFGATVGVECAGSDGQMVTYKEQTTNWFGTYGIRFAGTPDLTKCKARVIDGPTVCPNTIGSVQDLKLLFQMFDTELYTVDPLLAQPEKPMGFCQVLPPTPSHTPSVPFPPPVVIPPLPRSVLPPPAIIPPLPPVWHPPPLPPVWHPPPLPPVWHPPPLPFLKPSACSHMQWMMPEYRCHWKMVNPKTTVVGALGKLAGDKFGTNITLWQSLNGKGEVYRTLLREGTTALLNSYHSLGFFYPTLVVVALMNRALIESPHEALTTALSFRKANSGDPQYGGASCDFNACH